MPYQVLLVDDHKIMRDGIKAILRHSEEFAVFGEAGRHARSTIGVPSLPADAAVEVEALFEIA